MDKNEIFAWLQVEKALFPTRAAKQLWSGGAYSFMQTPRHSFGLLLVTSDRMDFVTPRESLSAKVGDIIFLPKACHYEAQFFAHAEDYLINFDTEGTFPLWTRPLKIYEDPTLSLLPLFKEIVEDDLRATPSPLRKRGLFYLLLGKLLADNTHTHRDLLSKAKTLLQNESISIAEIAKKCCVSESGLRLLFKQSEGVSPGAYRLAAKIKQAAYLLESTVMTVSQIADRLRFFDAAYFCKVFHAHMGMTPREYRKSKRP